MHFVPLTAVSFPFGDATAGRGDALSARYGWQWMPFEVGLGAKIMDEIYVGAYLGFGVGSPVLNMKCLARDARGRILRYANYLYRPDRYEIHTVVERDRHQRGRRAVRL